MSSSRDYLGSYRLIRLIRGGQSCNVWEAIKDGRQERVAIKVLLARHSGSKEEIEQLRNEGRVGVELDSEWEGEGEYSREESMTGRITARVIDVKPNGTLVLEARQSMIHDKEELMIVLTGTCRAADVSIDNTVLSTELYDLYLDKQHKGELKKSTKKGFLPTILDAIFGP